MIQSETAKAWSNFISFWLMEYDPDLKAHYEIWVLIHNLNQDIVKSIIVLQYNERSVLSDRILSKPDEIHQAKIISRQ